ncbi:MAG: EscR/YscR/HrcR family type III secretion system export apparatus protein [Chlamydiae bacterium]|nr:EscR/YscR/HrcR family type III secretion system export apparatus protein [Chlamydiota bacterium]
MMLPPKKILTFLLLLFVISCLWTQTYAADAPMTSAISAEASPDSTAAPGIITQVTTIAGLSLLPFVIMLLTSYVKVVIVLSLLRNALGVQQAPPNQVINGIALLVTVYVMFPTGLAMYNSASSYIEENQPKVLFSGQSADFILNVVDKAKEPLRDFLIRNTSAKHINGFYQLAYKSFPDSFRGQLQPNDFIVVIPSFITSQLKAAFEIGVLIYLPFFVIDLVTSNILLAMGMMMLSPLTIALPLKLLLIVMVDGWTLIIQGLVLSFR